MDIYILGGQIHMERDGSNIHGPILHGPILHVPLLMRGHGQHSGELFIKRFVKNKFFFKLKKDNLINIR